MLKKMVWILIVVIVIATVAVFALRKTEDTFNQPAWQTGTGSIFDGESLWIASNEVGKLLKIDPTTHELLGEVDIGARTEGLCFDGKNIWAIGGNIGSKSLYKIDPDTRDILSSYNDVGYNPTGVTFDGQNIWIADNFGAVIKFNVDSGKKTKVYDLPLVPFSIRYYSGYLWVTYPYLLQVNPGNGNVIYNSADSDGTVNDGLSSVYIDGSTLWVAGGRGGDKGKLLSFELVEGKAELRLSYSYEQRFQSVVVANDSVWVATIDGTKVLRLDKLNGEVKQITETGFNSEFASLITDGSGVWAVDYFNGELVKVN